MGMNAVSYTTPVFPIDLQRSEGEKLVSCEFYLLDISLIQSVSFFLSFCGHQELETY